MGARGQLARLPEATVGAGVTALHVLSASRTLPCGHQRIRVQGPAPGERTCRTCGRAFRFRIGPAVGATELVGAPVWRIEWEEA